MRTSRRLSEETKKKISRKMTGRKKSPRHIAHISQAMKQYWASIPDNKEEEYGTD